jgi:hypothetical protein
MELIEAPMELLLASRGRAKRCEAMMESALELAAHPALVRFRVRVDADDADLAAYQGLAARLSPHLLLHVGPRFPVPQLTVEMARACATDLMMLGCSDDIVWRTQHWDALVRETFAHYPDGLIVAYTNDQDGRPHPKCQHFFTTRRWLHVVGEGGWSALEHFGIDYWHEAVAQKVSRLVYLRHVVAEHMHMKHRYPDGTPKSLNDETYRAKRREPMSDRDIARLKAGEALMAEQAARVRGAMHVPG